MVMNALSMLFDDCQNVNNCPSIMFEAGWALAGSEALHMDKTLSRGVTYPCLVLKYCSAGVPHVTLAVILLPIAALNPCICCEEMKT